MILSIHIIPLKGHRFPKCDHCENKAAFHLRQDGVNSGGEPFRMKDYKLCPPCVQNSITDSVAQTTYHWDGR